MSRAPYNYIHDNYIAGHGDVFKHVVFCACIREMQKIHPEGVLIVDANCGDGVWDLNDCAKRGSIQYRKGILKVLAKYEAVQQQGGGAKIPTVVEDFIKLLLKSTGCTGSSDLDVYPGSPVYGQNLLRPKLDTHKLLDWYLDGVEWLRDESSFQQLNAYDPSTLDYMIPNGNTKHPIIFLDPPYDDAPGDDSYGGTKQLLTRILDKNPLATIIMWIPYINNHKFRWSYTKGIRDLAKEKCKSGRYFCSMNVNAADLQGSCLLICNPTPTFDDIVDDDAVHWLATTMNQGKDEFLVEQVMKKKKSTA